MASGPPIAGFGPFHRRTAGNPSENEKVATSGEVWGRPRGNIYAGLFAAVKAWEGPLPDGIVGYEFYTDVEPDYGSAPGWPQWREGSVGVRVIESTALVSIPVIVTKMHGPE